MSISRINQMRQWRRVMAVLAGHGFLVLFMSGMITNAAGLPPNIASKPVGFVRVAIPPNKSTLCSLPFALADRSIQSVLSGQLTGGTNAADADQILKWDPSSQQYRIIYKLAGSTTSALNGSWVESTLSDPV
ncbi:MAG: hypothetical protein WCG36_03985, partial [bacterium]